MKASDKHSTTTIIGRWWLSWCTGVNLSLKIYDGKRPKALDTFLKVLKIDEDEFYEIVEKHIVSPQKMPDKNVLKKSGSNIIPPDAEDWDKKFI